MRIFRWKSRKTKYVVGAFALTFSFLFYNDVKAVQLEVGVGSTLTESGPNPLGELSLLSNDGRWESSLGYIPTSYENIAYLGASRVVHVDRDDQRSPYLFLGVAGMITSGEEYYLSQNGNFYLGGGCWFNNVQVEFKHFSNAGMTMPNIGLNFLILTWRY